MCLLFLDPQNEISPSISSSVVLCVFVLLVYIVTLVLVFFLCPSFVRVVATFPCTVLLPLLSPVLPFFPLIDSFLYLVLLFQVSVSKISSVLLLNGNLSRGHQNTHKILKSKKRTDTPKESHIKKIRTYATWPTNRNLFDFSVIKIMIYLQVWVIVKFFMWIIMYRARKTWGKRDRPKAGCHLNPLKPELNPICHLLALLGAHHFLHVSRRQGRSPAEILGSNPSGGMDICLLWVSCVVR